MAKTGAVFIIFLLLVNIPLGFSLDDNYQRLSGKYVDFWMPVENQGMKFIDTLTSYEAVKVCDAAYEVLRDLVGAVPYEGEKITIAGEAYDGEVNKPRYAGHSGNPIQIIYDLRSPDNSILSGFNLQGGLTYEYPSFLLYFHEMTHDFTLIWESNFEKAFGFSGAAYVESFPRFIDWYMDHVLSADAELYGISEKTIASLFQYDSTNYYRTCTKPQDPSDYVSVRFMIETVEEYGWDSFVRFFKILDTLNLTCNYDKEIESDTIFIAIMSAATDTDLRPKYKQMGFNIDDALFQSLNIYKTKKDSTINLANYNYNFPPEKPLTIKGNIEPAEGNIRVTFTYTEPNNFALIHTTYSDINGEFNDTFSPNKIGDWSFRVSWGGNEDYRMAITNTVSFTVNSTILIDKITTSDDVCDINVPQEVKVHAKWVDDAPVNNGAIYLDGVRREFNATGWAVFQVVSSMAVRKTPIITAVESGSYKTYITLVPVPSITWDRVKVTKGGTTKEILNAGESAIVWYRALYESSNKPFTGADGTLLADSESLTWSEPNSRWEKQVTISGADIVSFNISGVRDEKQGLKAYSVSVPVVTVRWDRVKVTEGGVIKDSLNVGESTTLWFKAVYESDGTPFTSADGILKAGGGDMIWSPGSNRWERQLTASSSGVVSYAASGIVQEKDGLTSFISDAPPLKVEWKQGIPGFTMETILIGITIFIIFAYIQRRDKYT